MPKWGSKMAWEGMLVVGSLTSLSFYPIRLNGMITPREQPKGGIMGTVYKQPGSSRWWIQFYSNGKCHRESSGSTLKKDAVTLLKVREAAVATGKFHVYQPTKLEELVPLLELDYKINNRKTLYKLTHNLHHIISYFGDYDLRQITYDAMMEFVQHRMQDGKKPATIQRDLLMLSKLLHLAKVHNKLRELPRFPSIQIHNARQGFLSPEQFQQLMPKLPNYLKVLVQTAYLTGMRRAELLNLTWDMVDLDNAKITLAPEDTKTSKGRLIPLPVSILPFLGAIKSFNAQRFPNSPLVFPNEKGNKIMDFYESWNTAVKKAGMPGLLFHDLRRSCIRNLVRAGVNEVVAMTISGHKTRRVFDRYNISSMEDLTQAAAALDGYLANSKHITNISPQPEPDKPIKLLSNTI